MLVRDLVDGQEIDQVLLVRERTRCDGAGHMEVSLGDRTGAIAAAVAEELAALCEPGSAVRVAGRMDSDRLAVHTLRPAHEGEYAPGDLLDGPHRAAGRHGGRSARARGHRPGPAPARAAGSGVRTGRADLAPVPRRAGRQALPPGLPPRAARALAERRPAVSAISATFPGIDRDVAVTGALLHDIGKLEAYTADPLAIDMTDLGKLQGEIPLGYYRVRRLIEDLPGFPEELAAAVLHIILSHHGTLEHGSPVVPCTREATLVHMIDNLGGRLGSFDRLEKELPDGSRWSPFDRALGGGAWFSGRQAA